MNIFKMDQQKKTTENLLIADSMLPTKRFADAGRRLENGGSYLRTANTSPLRSSISIIQVENAISEDHLDSVGLAEVKRNGEKIMKRQNGNIFYYISVPVAATEGWGFI